MGAPAPSAEWISAAREYCSSIGDARSDPVSLYARPSATPCLVLREEARSWLRWRSCRRLSVMGAEGREMFVIRRPRRWILPTAAIYDRDRLVARLSTSMPLYHRHAFGGVGDVVWTIKTPFFSIGFEGTSRDGARIVGRIWEGTRTWIFLVEPGRDTPELLSALMFLHREWWRR